MWSFRGTISGEVLSQQKNLPMLIENFTLVNKAGITVGVNVYLIDGETSDAVCIAPYGGTLIYGGIYIDDTNRMLNENDQIKLVTTGSVDYDFEINNLPIP